jgi:uncharacterized protein YdeI (BOF family)
MSLRISHLYLITSMFDPAMLCSACLTLKEKFMKHSILYAVGAAALLSTSALAAGISIKTLPDEGQVTLKGTVDKVNSEREFTLRDSSGTINVDIESSQSVVLKEGDEVTVSGKVDKDITGKDINASNVQVNKGLAQGLKDTVKGIPGVSTTAASAFNIKNLPDNGMVKITGTVTDVSGEKEFTLKDDTGSIDVDVESSQNAALAEGARVTVIGNVDKGMLGKNINATEVIVIADATGNEE